MAAPWMCAMGPLMQGLRASPRHLKTCSMSAIVRRLRDRGCLRARHARAAAAEPAEAHLQDIHALGGRAAIVHVFPLLRQRLQTRRRRGSLLSGGLPTCTVFERVSHAEL